MCACDCACVPRTEAEAEMSTRSRSHNNSIMSTQIFLVVAVVVLVYHRIVHKMVTFMKAAEAKNMKGITLSEHDNQNSQAFFD